METIIAHLFDKKLLGTKGLARARQVEVGKWYKFDVICAGQDMVGYGKVVRIIDETSVEVEKYFELPSYRPYASTNWFDRLPYAIYE